MSTLVANNVTWVTSGGKALAYDLSVPDAAEGYPTPPVGGFPIVMLTSIWTNGAKSFPADKWNTQDFLDNGIALMSTTFRGAVSDSAPHPAGCNDLRAFLRYIRGSGNANFVNIDLDDITILGGSAGGNIAMMVGMTSTDQLCEGTVGVDLAQSSRVKNIVSIYPSPNFVLYPLPVDNSTPMYDQGNANVRAYTNVADWSVLTRKQKVSAMSRISPANYIDPHKPRILIVHGDADATNPIYQSRITTHRLRKLGYDIQLIEVPGAGHTIEDVLGAKIDDVISFIKP